MDQAQKTRKKSRDELRIEKEQRERPPLRRILSLQEMEVCPISAHWVYSALTSCRTLLVKCYPIKLGHTIHPLEMMKSVSLLSINYFLNGRLKQRDCISES